MAPVHEEGHPVLLGGYGVILGNLQGYKAGDFQFIAARGAGFSPHPAFQAEGRLEGEPVKLLKVRVRQISLYHHPLGQAGAIPHHHEAHLAAGAQVIDPTLKGYQVPDGFPQRGDVRHRGSIGWPS